MDGQEYKFCLNDFEDMRQIIEKYEFEKNVKVDTIFKVSLIKFKLNYDTSMNGFFNNQYNQQKNININPVKIDIFDDIEKDDENVIPQYLELKGNCLDTDVKLYCDLMYAFS